MRCPACGSFDDKVVDSRQSDDGLLIRRRRACLGCERRFTTRERIEETPLRVVKRDGTREDFERRKILTGLITACQKRPVSIDDLEKITQEVENSIQDCEEREIDTETIGNLVMAELKKLDQVAYVRFASVYKNFASPDDFAEIANEVQRPVKSRRRGPAKESS